MRYLIDTHVFLWFVGNSKELSRAAKNLLENPSNDILISIASLWEISIKTALGKLKIAGTYESVWDDLTDNSIRILPVSFAHTVAQNKLPLLHRDPFDRIIVSQAITEGIDLISADETFDDYLKTESVNRIW
jgi:PIN domain nuclease of toxin-antitoxin system